MAEQGVTDPNVISFSVAEMRLNPASRHSGGHAPLCGHRLLWLCAAGKGALDRAVQSWMERRHGWKVDMSWCCQTTGVVTAMGIAIRALTQPGDGVIVQTPVYPPFTASIQNNGRTVIETR